MKHIITMVGFVASPFVAFADVVGPPGPQSGPVVQSTGYNGADGLGIVIILVAIYFLFIKKKKSSS